jgi:hypothetical protein
VDALIQAKKFSAKIANTLKLVYLDASFFIPLIAKVKSVSIQILQNLGQDFSSISQGLLPSFASFCVKALEKKEQQRRSPLLF